MKTFKKLFLLLLILGSINSFSQKETINEAIKLTILVKDGNNTPISGAVILIDNVKQKRVANSAGYFKIKLEKEPKEITAFSPLIGVKTIKYNGDTSIVIKITKETNNYIPDTNYQKIVDPIQFRNIYDYLRGKVSGVNITTTNVISIRGNSTFNGSRSPLFVLNGVQVDEQTFGAIVPTTIRSVKILKGPETAIYGLQGANGVIEVVTMLK
jgi:TonB-dependent SusC/RagA subfamily outer membrane receptor